VTLLFGGKVIEEGPVAQVLEAPKHAYARALLDACPRSDRPDLGLRPIPAELIARLRREVAAP
jgi:peptide/nickel transport system ATP-binding protein